MDSVVSSGKKIERIPKCKREECLVLFRSGCGYKKAARLSGLNAYTVREYLRRYKAGDLSWADRGKDISHDDYGSRSQVQYRDSFRN